MEEKTLVKGTLGNVKMLRNICWGVGLFLAAMWWLYTYTIYAGYSKQKEWEYWMTDTISSFCIIGFAVLIVCIIVGAVAYSCFSKIEITVTDKRVYGSAAFGKRVDLPIDSISAVGTSAFKGISVATSSGAIKFYMIQNRDEIHNVISNIISNRQNKQTVTTTIKEVSQSNADELKKFKELLDSGIISQEEFEAKKKQLLGL